MPEKGNSYYFLTTEQYNQLLELDFTLSGDWKHAGKGYWYMGTSMEDFDELPSALRPIYIVYMLSTQGGGIGG